MAFQSGMKEAKTMTFEFPDDDPKEWELLWAVLDPFSDEKVNEDNVVTLFPWFQKLCISQGVDACANVLFHMLKKRISAMWIRTWATSSVDHASDESVEANIDCVLKLLPMSVQCTDKRAEQVCGRYLNFVAKSKPWVFHEQQLKQICSLFCEDENCKIALSEVVAEFLPTDVEGFEDTRTVVLNNPVLLLSFMKMNRYKSALDRIPSILSTLGNDRPDAHSAFKNDALLGSVLITK
eukprot:Sro1339_g264320.2  (237) ;mRNA; r:22767-23477